MNTVRDHEQQEGERVNLYALGVCGAIILCEARRPTLMTGQVVHQRQQRSGKQNSDHGVLLPERSAG